MAKLTKRKQQILTLMSEGLGNDDIARRLSISIHTVKVHIIQMMDRFSPEQRSRCELIAWGFRNGVLK